MDVFLIFVAPKFRRRGIAQNFLKDIKKFCKLHLINKIILEVNEDNQAANILYQKFGFKIVLPLPNSFACAITHHKDASL